MRGSATKSWCSYRVLRQHGLSCSTSVRNFSEPGPPTMVFTKHETRNTNHGLHAFHESQLPTHDFPPFPTISRHFPAPPPPSADQVSTRRPPFLVSRPDCRAAPPGHCFPARCGAAMERHERHIAPEPVSARRQPQLPPPSGFVPLRRTPNEPMLRKRNVMDCVDGSCGCIDTRRGRAYHIVSFVHLGGRS